jgi:uncharacterized membrane protein
MTFLADHSSESALKICCRIITFLLGVEHMGFFAMESHLWRTVGTKVFRVKHEEVNTTAPLAAIQGVYNLMVGTMCVLGAVPWLRFNPNYGGTQEDQILELHFTAHQDAGMMFFTFLIFVVGVYGWLSLGARNILLVQGLPGWIGMIMNICNAYSDPLIVGEGLINGKLNMMGWILSVVFTVYGIVVGVMAVQWKKMNDEAAVAHATAPKPMAKGAKKEVELA